MKVCTNCKARLGCSCQVRSASDGTRCCAKCIASYEANLKKKEVTAPESPQAPEIVSITYDGPGMQIN